MNALSVKKYLQKNFELFNLNNVLNRNLDDITRVAHLFRNNVQFVFFYILSLSLQLLATELKVREKLKKRKNS